MIKKAAAALAVILAIAAVCILGKPIYYRLYPGDRITGYLTVTVDGEAYALGSEQFEGLTSFDAREDGAAKLGIHAGEYGGYPIVLHLPFDAVSELQIRCFQANWWDVAKFDLHMEIQTAEQTVTATGTYSTVGEGDCKRIEDMIHDTKPIENRTCAFSFGL